MLSTPLTFVPGFAEGVIVTVIVLVSPGWIVTGVPRSAFGSTLTAQKSPVEDVTSGSKPGVRALRSTVEFAVGAPSGPTAPISLTSVNQMPVDTVPCRSFTVAAEIVLPFCASVRSPTTSMPCRPGVSSTIAGRSDTATAVRLCVLGGTRNVGAACAGNVKDCGPNGDTSCKVCSLAVRGSICTLIGATPGLVTVTCAVIAVPAGILVRVELGRPTADTWLWLNPIDPVKSCVKAVPGTGF